MRKDRIIENSLAVALLIGVAVGTLAWTSKPRTQFRSKSLFQQDPEAQLIIRKFKDEAMVFDADDDQQLDPGDRIRYILTYENPGSETVANVIIEDDYDESLITVSQISEGGADNGDLIRWDFDVLEPGEGGELSYVITLKPSLKLGSYQISNVAAIYGDGVERSETSILQEVNVEPTATNLPTETSIPSPTSVPTETSAPTATPRPAVPIVGASVPTGDPVFYWIMGGLILSLEVGGLVVIAIIARSGQFKEGERSRVVRVAMVVTMVVGAVLIMGIFGGIERGAAAGILGTVAGYLLRGIREE